MYLWKCYGKFCKDRKNAGVSARDPTMARLVGIGFNRSLFSHEIKEKYPEILKEIEGANLGLYELILVFDTSSFF
jgi:hypothetical protein